MRREDLYARSSLDYDGFDKFLERLGGNPNAMMRKAGLKAAHSKNKIHFVSWAGLVRYFEIAARELDEPYLGLKWAFEIPEDYRNSGPTLFLSSIASDFKHFLDMVLDYQKIHTNGVTYSYQQDMAAGELIGFVDIHPLSPPCRQFCEHIMGAIGVMGRRYMPDFYLKRVTLQYDAPADIEWYEKAFECPIIFNAPRNSLVMEGAVLEMKQTKLTTKIISPFVKAYFKWQLERNPRAKVSLSSTIVEILPDLFGVQKTDIETVAKTLGVHPKKLQRLLSDEGTSYKSLLDDMRKSMAERLLVETDISVMRVAKMLDYSSDRPFTAAARRWFDMTPTQYRKAMRKNGR